MRLRSLSLAAPLLLAGTALAQNPNAIGLWRTDQPAFAYFVIPGIPAGQTGNSVWVCLPPDMITYFRPQTAGGLRELDFRGVEIKVVTPPNSSGSTKLHQINAWEIRKAVQAPPPNEGSLIPFIDTVTPSNGLYVSAASPGSINIPNGTTGYGLYTIKALLANSVPVPAGSSAGDGLCWRMLDYQKQFGSPAGTGAQTSLMMACTTNETGTTTSPGFSGQTTANGANALVQNTTEFCVTFFFEQSMIQPVKNAKLVPAGSVVPGGTLPATISFPVQMDDGHGALTPKAGEYISYSANSNKILKPGASTDVWIVPFVLFEGDTGGGGGVDPQPENWVGNGGAVQNAFIYPMSLKKWLNDTAILFGLVINDFGGTLNPNDSTLGLWLGVDLPNLVNINVLLNSFSLSDTSAPAFSGPETKMYDKATNPGGIMVRNYYAWNTTLSGELRSLHVPQVGYTPIAPLTPGGDVGIGQHPGVPQVAGLGFSMTAWVLDKSSPVSPIGFNILDVTNVIRITL